MEKCSTTLALLEKSDLGVNCNVTLSNMQGASVLLSDEALYPGAPPSAQTCIYSAHRRGDRLLVVDFSAGSKVSGVYRGRISPARKIGMHFANLCAVCGGTC